MKIKKISVLLLTLCLTSCEQAKLVTHYVSGYFVDDEYVLPMNTLISLSSFYESQYNKYVNEFDNITINLSKEVDRYHNYDNLNNLKVINDSCGTDKYIKVSDDLFELLDLGIELTKLTEGSFNIAMGSLIDLYRDKLDLGSNRVDTLPGVNDINKAMLAIPSYTNIENIIELNYQTHEVKLNKNNNENVIISLGAIGKGFIMQKCYDLLSEDKKNCFFINAGSSTMATIGDNKSKNNGNYNISIRKPLLSQNIEVINTFSFSENILISTSADYESNFFYTDSNNETRLMHHIINPSTGVSSNSVREVSLFSSSCPLSVLDALSTALFNFDSDEKRIEIINRINERFNCSIDYMFVKNDRSYDTFNILLSDNLKSKIIGSFPSDVNLIEK